MACVISVPLCGGGLSSVFLCKSVTNKVIEQALDLKYDSLSHVYLVLL